MTTFALAETEIDRIRNAAADLMEAVTHEAQLEDQRAMKKFDAIRRLMQTTNELTGKPHSASSAEAIVESDPEYAKHREWQRLATANTIRARAVLKAAEFRAELAVRAYSQLSTVDGDMGRTSYTGESA
jgi:hypothetical protein